MTKLANMCLGKSKKELILGTDNEEVINGLADFFTQQGQTVALVDEDDFLKQNVDVCIYLMDWPPTSVYLSLFKAEGYCPNLTVSINHMTTERILDNITGFIEGIRF